MTTRHCRHCALNPCLSRPDMNSPLPLHHLLPPTDHHGDTDPQETQEWRESFQALVDAQGSARGSFMLQELLRLATGLQVSCVPPAGTPYVNTIPASAQPDFPGDLDLETRLGAIMRWNALAMVVRANGAYGELGGHIASYASAADLFEVGFNHFFQARSDNKHGGDLVFFQPHS